MEIENKILLKRLNAEKRTIKDIISKMSAELVAIEDEITRIRMDDYDKIQAPLFPTHSSGI